MTWRGMVRLVLSVLLLYQVWKNAHWSVFICCAGSLINGEILCRVIGKAQT